MNNMHEDIEIGLNDKKTKFEKLRQDLNAPLEELKNNDEAIALRDITTIANAIKATDSLPYNNEALERLVEAITEAELEALVTFKNGTPYVNTICQFSGVPTKSFKLEDLLSIYNNVSFFDFLNYFEDEIKDVNSTFKFTKQGSYRELPKTLATLTFLLNGGKKKTENLEVLINKYNMYTSLKNNYKGDLAIDIKIAIAIQILTIRLFGIEKPIAHLLEEGEYKDNNLNKKLISIFHRLLKAIKNQGYNLNNLTTFSSLPIYYVTRDDMHKERTLLRNKFNAKLDQRDLIRLKIKETDKLANLFDALDSHVYSEDNPSNFDVFNFNSSVAFDENDMKILSASFGYEEEEVFEEEYEEIDQILTNFFETVDDEEEEFEEGHTTPLEDIEINLNATKALDFEVTNKANKIANNENKSLESARVNVLTTLLPDISNNDIKILEQKSNIVIQENGEVVAELKSNNEILAINKNNIKKLKEFSGSGIPKPKPEKTKPYNPLTNIKIDVSKL